MTKAGVPTDAMAPGVSGGRRLAEVDVRLRAALNDLARRQAARGVRVFLFGSMARTWPLAPVGADIDLGYEVGGEARDHPALRRKLEGEVAGLPTIRPIDLVDFSGVSEVFRCEAMKSAIRLPDERSR